MPIVSGDIQFRLSGGASNTDPNASLGGVMSSTAITDNTDNNMFDDVAGAESTPGDTEYRGFYVRNNHATLTLQNAVLFISQDTTSTNDEVDVGLAAEAIDVDMATIANESTAPASVTFSHPTTAGAGLSIGNLAAGSRKGFWLRRTVSAGAAAINGNSFKFKVQGDTAA